MKHRDILAILNRGRISRHALARTDVSRVALSAEVQNNWMPRTLGSMSLRPGLRYRGEILGDGAYIPFQYSSDDQAILEMSAGVMRVWNDGFILHERDPVSTTIDNPDFTGSLANWTVADEAGAASTWEAGQLKMVGTGVASARLRQTNTVSGADQSVVHALRIDVTRGPVILRIGTTAGADDIFRQAVLRTGVHSIAFTPGTSPFTIEFSSSLEYATFVNSCDIEPGGVFTLPTPWADAEACKQLRWQQSSDVIFIACGDCQQRRIERRSDGSWSIVLYEVSDGPFLTENVTNTTITPSGLNGEISLTSSRSIFQAGHVGGLYRIESQGQLVSQSVAAVDVFTDPIRVTGVTVGRAFEIVMGGSFVGTVTLQRSIAEPGSWVSVAEWTAPVTTTYNDGLDNSIVYYRIGFTSWTSGTAFMSLEYAVGSITGIVRVTGYNSETSVDAIVLDHLGGTDATEVWAEGSWSDVQGWTDAPSIWEGRLWWSGEGQNYASVSDAFHSFDPDFEGDAGPINRRIGEGAVDRTNWMMPLQRLIVGTDGGEHSVRSTSFDEPVTPSNYNTKAPSSRGSAQVPAVTSDGRGYFVSRSERAVYELEYDPGKYAFQALNTTLLVPEIGDSHFVRLGVQQEPDTRIHAIRADGTAAILIRDEAENVMCWVELETNGGEIQDVCVLAGADEDKVYYRVKRVIDGNTVYYHEKIAKEENCRGGTLNRQADSFVIGSGTIDGLSHLEGETIVAWGDGADMGTFTVTGGAAVPAATAVSWVAGLPYTADYQSSKLAGETGLGLSLTQVTRINKIGLILADTHKDGLQYGPDFDNLDDLPNVEDGADVEADKVWEAYDEDMIEFPGDWSTDNRLCLRATAPRPCTVLAAVLNVDRQDHD